MNLSLMSPGTLRRLCDPVDASIAQILFSSYETATHTLFEMRTMAMPRDLEWIIAWMGAEGNKQIADHRKMRNTLYSAFVKEAATTTIQPLVVTEQMIPRLLLSVCIEGEPYTGYTGRRANYVIYPTISVATKPLEALGALRHAVRGCFLFEGVEALFVCLDRHKSDMVAVTLQAGFGKAAITDPLQSGNRYFFQRRHPDMDK